jgi:hypothetical protein
VSDNWGQWMTLEQFLALGIKCFHCDKTAKWIASKDAPGYCDEHFPYYDVINSRISMQDNVKDD